MVATTKVDLKKEQKQLYTAPTGEVSEVPVPPANYLMVSGVGDPNTSQEYKEAVEALFSVSYALKFSVKKAKGIDYAVMPLEGLWWTEAGKPFQSEDKSSWCWTTMIRQPEYVTQELYRTVLDDVKKKKKLPALSRIRFETYAEGKAIQIMHVGPYSEEHATIERLHHYARERGYKLTGKHHEIYLNNPPRTAPPKLKTILRQPVQ
jgi:hypothetical protein